MPKRKTGVNPLAYTGVRALTPPNIIFEDRAPKPTDHIGHVLGDWWVYARDRNTTPTESPRREDIWILVSKDQRLAKQLYPNVNKPKAVWINMAGEAQRSAFEARMTTDKNNVTGAGTIYKLQWDVTDSNIGNNFSLTNNEYTVPTTGVYQFNCCVSVGNITSSMKSMAISMRFSGVTRALTHENPYAVLSDSGIVRRNCNISRHLTAGTKVSVVIGISGGSSNTAQVWSGESTGVTRVRTWFTGFRVS